MKKTASAIVLTPEQSRAETLTADVRAELERIGQGFWRIGEALNELIEKKLYGALGYPTFRAYVEARLPCEISQAYKLIRVVRNYFREDAEQLGFECAIAAIPLAKGLGVDPGDLVRKNIHVAGKPILEASKRDIARAAAETRVRHAQLRARAPIERERKREDKAIGAALKQLLADAGMPRPASIKVDSRADEVVLRIPRSRLAAHVTRSG